LAAAFIQADDQRALGHLIGRLLHLIGELVDLGLKRTNGLLKLRDLIKRLLPALRLYTRRTAGAALDQRVADRVRDVCRDAWIAGARPDREYLGRIQPGRGHVRRQERRIHGLPGRTRQLELIDHTLEERAGRGKRNIGLADGAAGAQITFPHVGVVEYRPDEIL
jgi:hypothetical protein